MRKFCLLMTFFFICFTQIAIAAFDSDNYDWNRQYSFNATILKKVSVNNQWDHSVYYYQDAKKNNRCLVIFCHGGTDKYGYYIQILGKHRHDYAEAIAETLAWHYKNNYISPSGKYDYVFLTTCYSGYAKYQNVNLPVFNIPCVLSNQNKYPNLFSEKYDANGKLTGLEIWYATPKTIQLNSPTGNLPINESKSKRGNPPARYQICED